MDHSKKKKRTNPPPSQNPPSSQGQKEKKEKKKKIKTSASSSQDIFDIDNIFAQKKPKVVEPQANKNNKRRASNITQNNVETKKRKSLNGMQVYTEEELQLGTKGGGTNLCPFDCKCCF